MAIVGITSEEIKNMALFELGFVDEVDFDVATNPTVKKVNRVYEPCKQSILSDYRWRFSIRRQELATRADADNTYKYKYNFTLPDDMLTFNNAYTGDEYIYTIRAFETTQTYLNTDYTTAFLAYNANVAETEWPQYFINYFKYKLAEQLCFNLTGDSDLLKYLALQAQSQLKQARNIDARQNPTRHIKSSPFTNIRG